MGNSQGKPVDWNGEVSLNHFRLLRVVGRGAFGKVRIVQRKDTDLSFALKYIRKDEVVRSESVRNIIRERRMLEHVNHPFICNLRYSFQDIEYMYLVVDLMSGGDLRFHICRKTFTEDAVRFWVAELGCALRYIHGQGIIHRDIKPDNVLLDSDGHVHLTDFNVASDLVKGKVLTSKSGTLAYLAPEVYAGQGYDERADWWSLGVLFYECIYNKRPFEGHSESSLSTLIRAANPKYPVTNPAVLPECRYAIEAALQPNPSKRLGATWESFIHHEFFRVIDFEALERKQIDPVFVPSSDKTNFDATYDLEELLLEEAPLEARARRQKPRERLKDDATEKEIREEELYRMIDNEFKPFDYTVAAYRKIADGEVLVNGNRLELPMAPDRLPSDTHAQARAITTDEARSAVPAVASDGSTQPLYQTNSAEGNRGHSSGSTTRGRPTSGRDRRQPVNQNQGQNPGEGRPLPPYPRSYTSSSLNRREGPPNGGPVRSGGGPGMLVASPTGGVQMTLDGHGSWSDLARQDATLPADASGANNETGGNGRASEGSGGVFGFLRGRRGRAGSPKPKERGVLGKEGARQVIG